MGLFEIGFVVWVYSFFKKYINFKYVKFFWFFFHLAVLWLAAVYASKIVSKGLELPSSDYSYTVSFLHFFAIYLLFYISLQLLDCYFI